MNTYRTAESLALDLAARAEIASGEWLAPRIAEILGKPARALNVEGVRKAITDAVAAASALAAMLGQPGEVSSAEALLVYMICENRRPGYTIGDHVEDHLAALVALGYLTQDEADRGHTKLSEEVDA